MIHEIIEEILQAGYVDLAYSLQCKDLYDRYFQRLGNGEGVVGLNLNHIECVYIECMYGITIPDIFDLWINYRSHSMLFEDLNLIISDKLIKYGIH